MKYYYLIPIIIFSFGVSYSQKILSIDLIKDSSIDTKKINFEYFNGKFNIPVTDSFKNNILRIKGTFYSEVAPFSISYIIANQYYNKVFFIGDKSAKINIRLCKLKCREPFDFLYTNAKLINDTGFNANYRAIYIWRLNSAKPINELFKKYSVGQVFKNDSLKTLYNLYYKELNNQTILFLKEHASEYFSLWYFRTQIVLPSLSLLRIDTTYLKTILLTFTQIFPKRYQNSLEGNQIRKFLESVIHPLELTNLAPYFSKKDINGKNIVLANLKGKYVLLDFWASWCPPCMELIPELNELRKNYSVDKFIMIGVNKDPNIEVLKKTINEKQMNWIQLFDNDNSVTDKFSVFKFPTFFLINPDGNIIFKGEGLSDKQRLNNLLENLIGPSKY